MKTDSIIFLLLLFMAIALAIGIMRDIRDNANYSIYEERSDYIN